MNETSSMNQRYLETESVGKLICKYSIPCILSLLVASLYNIVDQLFISNADYLGSYGNAANSVIFPLTVAALAIAVMIGDGACAYISICFGRRDSDKAGQTIGNAVVLSIIVSLILTLLYFVFMTPILNFFGASINEKTFAFAKEYFTYIAMGIPVYMFGQAMNPIIRSTGAPRFAMFSNMIGAVLNIILDPIMIYPMHMGMMGAAAATVIGQIVTAVLSAVYLIRLKTVHFQKRDFTLSWSLERKFLPLGMTSLLSQISVVASMAAVNTMIVRTSLADPVFAQMQYSQIPMAVLGIVMKFFQIIISVSVGLAAGCIPLVGYNSGAGRTDRIKKFLNTLIITEAVVGLVGLVIAEVFPSAIIQLFGAANESAYYQTFAVKAFRIYLCMMIPACINKGMFIFLQSLGKAYLSTGLSMLREIVFGVGLTLLIPVWFGLDGVLYSMPVSDLLAFLVVGSAVISTYRQLNQTLAEKEPEAKPLVEKTSEI
jgi:putative MATE family efflux protein